MTSGSDLRSSAKSASSSPVFNTTTDRRQGWAKMNTDFEYHFYRDGFALCNKSRVWNRLPLDRCGERGLPHYTVRCAICDRLSREQVKAAAKTNYRGIFAR